MSVVRPALNGNDALPEDEAQRAYWEEFNRFLEARNNALIAMDFDYMRNQVGRPVSDEMCLLTLHKARYECTAIPAEHRHTSGRWLREHGYGRMTGTPLLPDGELPE